MTKTGKMTGKSIRADIATDAAIEVRDLTVAYKEKPVLWDIDLQIPSGILLAIVGPNGAGKTTLFNVITGVYEPNHGSILFDGKSILGLKPYQIALAGIARTFQNIRLFQSMTVLENVIEAPIHVLKIPKNEAVERAESLLHKVGIHDRKHYHPAHLSGGQQQRVAIARALAMEPDMLLFDEPTSALDPELVGEVLQVMRNLAEEGRTMIVVTHEIGFAQDVSSRVVFLHEGSIEEEGAPSVVFKNPSSERFRQFVSKQVEN